MKNTLPTLLIFLLLAASVAQAQFTYITNAGAITITGYTGPGGDVTIPDTINGLPVTTIAGDAFFEQYSLTSIAIPGSVTSIGDVAFGHCTSLTSVTIGNGVTSIGREAFNDCTSLTAITVDAQNMVYSSVDGVLLDKSQTTLIQCPWGKIGTYTIPNTVTSIASAAFASCTRLTSVAIPDSVTAIPGAVGGGGAPPGPGVFANCASLTNVTIGNSVTSIGFSAFNSCTSLASVTIPNSVTNIGSLAFYSCTSLTNVTILDSVTTIGDLAFSGCTGLTSVTMGNGVTDIGDHAFGFCSSLASVTIPDSVISIGDFAFEGCTSLTEIKVGVLNPIYSSMDGVLFNKNETLLIGYPNGKGVSYTIPDSVTSIGFLAFEGCSSLASVTIPNSVTSIGSFAFYSCTGLTNVTIPNSVTNIGDSVFDFCTSLTGVYFKGNDPVGGGSEFDYDNNVTVYYLPGTTGWGAMFFGRPAVLWNPQIQTGDASFGLHGNQFGFNIIGTADIPVLIEACANLANPVWLPLQTITLTNGLVHFSEPVQTNSPSRFYRLRQP